MFFTAQDRPFRGARLLPFGADQQGRYLTRAVRSEQWPDTIATDHGSADALGDDQAARHSAWGAIDETAALEGGQFREPAGALGDTGPSAGWVLSIGVLCIAAVAACAAVAAYLPH